MLIKGFTSLLFTSILSSLLFISVGAQHMPLSPDGPHCINTGPISLPSDFCGCTWGAVYYRGEAVYNTSVSLSFGTLSTISTTNRFNAEIFPFYSISGTLMGAKLNDIMTVTTELAGQTATRSFRARPDGTGDQEVPLIIPETSIWTPWLSAGYTRTLVAQGDTLWAGGPAGLISLSVASNVSVTQLLSWSNPSVVALALAANGRHWVAGPTALAEFDGTSWQNRPLPFAAPLRALAVDPTSGALWAAGWQSANNLGSFAVYSGSWQSVSAVPTAITSLVVDSHGDLWAGTWGDGVYRHDHNATANSGWTQISAAEGLASDEVYALAAAGDHLWVATNSYEESGRALGGVSRYSLTAKSWFTFTTAQGLPADPENPLLTAPIYSLATDGAGKVLAGTLTSQANQTRQVIYLLATPTLWVKEAETGPNRVNALAIVGESAFAARADQLDRLVANHTPGTVPTVTIHSAVSTLALDSTFVLTATAGDNDEENDRVINWEWISDQAGHLCTTANICFAPGHLLGEGTHQIKVRVQDDEGVWSQVASVTVSVHKPVIVQPTSQVYLPLVTRQ